MSRSLDLRAEHTRTERALDSEPRTSGQIDPGRPPLRMLRFKSGGDNHIVCRDWDGVNEGDVDVLVAMDPQLQKQFVGTGHTYETFQSRERDSDEEAQVINPAYEVNQILFALSANGTGVNVVVSEEDAEEEETEDVVWLEISPSRHWSKSC